MPSSAALLLIDVINDFDFPEAPQLLRYAIPMAKRIAELKRQARERRLPVIYCNDNFGRWRSDFAAQVEHCLDDKNPGREIVELLHPDVDDYFVLKPKHSGFYSTTLDVLLESLDVDTVILTGVAANICVLFTANDAYMRDYKVIVPADCIAANEEKDTSMVLRQMQLALKADTRPSTELDLARLGDD
jgi:nicotinamidase-related amidase